jgi:uncharacterized protein YxeA
MKKVISLILAIAIALLVGCADVEYAEADTQNDYIQGGYGYCEIIVDKETGVNYVVYANYHKKSGGITVRLNTDGTLYVSEVE